MSRSRRKEQTTTRRARAALKRAQENLRKAEDWESVQRYGLEVLSADRYEVQ